MAKSVLINILGNPASALAALEEVGVKARETAGETDKVGESGKSASSKFSAFGAAAAGTLILAATAAIDMGNKLEDAHATLVQAVKDAGGSMDALAGPLARVDKQMETFGFTNADTENALAQMTIGLHSGQKAMDDIGLAANIARARHMDLASAALLVVKASEGQTVALRRAGIDLPIMASGALKVKTAEEALAKAQQALHDILAKTPDAVDANSKAHAKYEAALQQVQARQQKLSDLQTAGGQIIDALSQRYGGQAAAAADTFSGRLEVARARIEDLGARIGMVLIPILERLMTAIAAVVGWLTKHKTVAEALGIAVGVVLVTAIGAYIVSMAMAAIATIAATWPILAVIAAAALLGVGIAYLATHWHQVWSDIKQWTGDAVNFIRDHWYIVLGIPIVGWLLAIALNWNRIYKGISDAAGWFLGGVIGAWHDFIGFFAGIPNTISQIASGMWQGIEDAFRSSIDTVIGWWNDFANSTEFTLPKISIGPISVGGEHIGPIVPTIPMLATGGFVTAEGLAYIHQGERVLPAAQVNRAGSSGGDGGTVEATIVLDGRIVGQALIPYIRTAGLQAQKRNATRFGLA